MKSFMASPATIERKSDRNRISGH